MVTTDASTDRPTLSAGRRAGGLVPPWVPSAVLVVLWLIVRPFVDDYANPDGPAYVGVARLWLSGEWSTAVNAYWGPLVSWAMAPLLALGVPGLDALRLVLLAGALLTLIPLRTLARAAGASAAATDVLLLATAPLLVYNALFGLYPDVLLAAALLGTCALLARPDFPTSTRTAAGVGGLAAVAFLAKAYALPVVVVFLPLGALLHVLAPRRVSVGLVARRLAVALGTFVAVAGAWILILSIGYGALTISTSAGFNARLVGPTSAGNPYNEAGLFEPPRDDVLSAWEEPSRLEIPQRPADDRAGPSEPSQLRYRASNVVANARIVVGSILRRGTPLLLLAVVALGWSLRRRSAGPPLTGPLLMGTVFAVGLTFIIAIERYTWVTVLCLVPAAALGLDLVTRRRRSWVVAGGALLIAVMTVTSALGLAPRVGDDEEVTEAAAVLDDTAALDGTRVATMGSWQETYLLCFRVGCQYLGKPHRGPIDEVTAELRGAGATHLVVWRDDLDLIPGAPPPPEGADLVVYAVGRDGLALQQSVDLGS